MRIKVNWELEGPKSGSFYVDSEDFEDGSEQEISADLGVYVQEEFEQRCWPAVTNEDNVVAQLVEANK